MLYGKFFGDDTSSRAETVTKTVATRFVGIRQIKRNSKIGVGRSIEMTPTFLVELESIKCK